MSYSIRINFEMSGEATPLIPQDFIIADSANPSSIETGETVSLKFKADGMYFKLKARKGATVTGADSTWACPSPNTDAEIVLSNATSDVDIVITAIVNIAPQLVSKPFLYQIAAPVDTRLVLSKKEMSTISDNFLPDTYFALCKDDGHFYLYSKANEPSDITGRFVLITDVVEGMIHIDGGEVLDA